jgi:hypothetical protein
MRFKLVFRFDQRSSMLRLFRLLWTKGVVGDGHGYSAKLSLALWPKFFAITRDWHEWAVTIAGVRVHYLRAYGGIIP